MEIVLSVLGLLGVISAIMVVKTKNPVNAVFYLVLVFAEIAGVIIMLGAEFMGVIFIVVYVGAIAVLFLFVVMMLNVRKVEANEHVVRYIPIGGLIGGILLMEVLYVYKEEIAKGGVFERSEWIREILGVSNIEGIGEVLYTYNIYGFMLAGMVLLVAMIGTIVLTLHHSKEVKKQDIYKQEMRKHKEAIEYKS